MIFISLKPMILALFKSLHMELYFSGFSMCESVLISVCLISPPKFAVQVNDTIHAIIKIVKEYLNQAAATPLFLIKKNT